MSLPKFLENRINESRPRLTDITPRTSFDEELISRVCDPSGAPYGNCSGIELANGSGTRLTYIRRFGYRIVGGIAQKTADAPGMVFAVSTGDGSDLRHVCTVIEGGLSDDRIEDARLYNAGGETKAVTSYIYRQDDMASRGIGIAVFTVSLSRDGSTVALTPAYKSWDSQHGTAFPRCQKNWMPIEGRETEFVYLIADGCLTTFDISTGSFSNHPFPIHETLFGSTPTVRLENGHLLMLCHAHPNMRYIFRLLEVDDADGLVLLRDSGWFRFSDSNIAFCTWMTERDGMLEFVYTEDDCRTFKTRIGHRSLMRINVR